MSQSVPIPEIQLLTIGRNPNNHVVLTQKDISSYHAKLYVCSTTSFILEDTDSKNGTFVDGFRITRKLVDRNSKIQFAKNEYKLSDIINFNIETGKLKLNPLDFTEEFYQLRNMTEQYEEMKLACRNKEKSIRMWSTITSSVIGVGALVASIGTGGLVTIIGGSVASAGGASIFTLLSSMGLGMLIPSISSNLLSTDEKLLLLDKEYRLRYCCPNPNCQSPFGNREWKNLALQKICKSCKAIWVK